MVQRLRESLWLIPATFTVGAVLLAMATLEVDRTVDREVLTHWFFFSAGSSGARDVLSTIAGSIMTVTGVVFSVTIVALQLASTQFTPRVLRSFIEDRTNQLVLATFIGTFVYALLVLRAVRSPEEGFEQFVPVVSVTIAVVLALFSIAALIYFINHIAHSMQVETIIDRVTEDVLGRVDALFPMKLGDPAEPGGTSALDWRKPDGEAHRICASEAGYLQNIDEETLLQLVEERDLAVRMEVPIGRFVAERDVLALAWPGDRARESADALAEIFHVGNERTLYQDVNRGMIELTDIAVRALSPSVNDPTTAIVCIDRITQILKALGRRRFPDRLRTGEDGRQRILTLRPTFDEIVRIPYGQLRHFGAGIPIVALTLVESLGRVAEDLNTERIGPLLAELLELLQSVRRKIDSATDLERVEAAGRRALTRMQPAHSGERVASP